MTRKEFLELIGIAVPLACLGCNKIPLIAPQSSGSHKHGGHTDTLGPKSIESYENYPKKPPPPPKVDFTLNIDEPANFALKIPGGSLYFNNVIVALTLAGQYIAAQEQCTHAGSSVSYAEQTGVYRCSTHGSVFNADGTVINGPAAIPLKTYTTQLSGSLLRVFE